MLADKPAYTEGEPDRRAGHVWKALRTFFGSGIVSLFLRRAPIVQRPRTSAFQAGNDGFESRWEYEVKMRSDGVIG